MAYLDKQTYRVYGGQVDAGLEQLNICYEVIHGRGTFTGILCNTPPISLSHTHCYRVYLIIHCTPINVCYKL